MTTVDNIFHNDDVLAINGRVQVQRDANVALGRTRAGTVG